MASIRPSLESGDSRIATGKHIHDLAFSFITPLEAKDNVKF